MLAPKPTTLPADVQAALDRAAASGLPQPRSVVAHDDRITLHFGVNDTPDVDAWAAHVGAVVGHDDWTYGELDEFDQPIGAPCHGYGTGAEGSEYGRWLGREVGLGCEVLGPHPANANQPEG